MSKIAVVGAGIVGVCVAHFLKKNGHDVILYDQNEPGSQTSFGNAGLFANHECVTANSPQLWKNLPSMLFSKNGPLAIDWLYILTHLPWAIRFLRNCTHKRVQHIAHSLSSFSSHAELSYEEIFNEVNVSEYIVNKEPIFLYETRKLFEEARFSFDLRKKYNVGFDILSKEKILELEPSLKPVFYNGIIYKGESFTRSPIKITKKIFDNFINNGGQFILSEVDSIYKKDELLFLESNGKKYQLDKIVIAAGVWSNKLAKTIGDDFPLDTERGYHIVFQNKNNLISRSVGWAKTGFYMTPMEDGIRAAGTVEIAGIDKPMNHNRLKMIENTARKIIPQLGKVQSKWMGFRPTLPDSLPIIGESKKCKNVYYAFGHQHLGLSLAAVTGKTIHSLIDNTNSNINILPFDPYRF